MRRACFVLRTSAAIVGLLLVTLAVPLTADRDARSRRFDLVETTIPAVQQALRDHVITTGQLVRMYLKRIATYDDKSTATRLNSYIHVNDDLLDDDDRDDGDDRGDADDHDLG